MSFTSAAQVQLKGGTVRPSVFFRMACNDGSVVRLWGGDGPFTLPANAFDASATAYTGVGQIIELPVMGALLGGKAERVEFKISGVDATTAALADTEASIVRGAQIQVGLVFFDNDWQPLTIAGSSVIRWCAQYEADSPGGSHDGLTWTVSLSAASAMSGRRRPKHSYYTPKDQRARSPTDAFCDGVPQLNSGTSIAFGPKP
jgi:hypothetical protein